MQRSFRSPHSPDVSVARSRRTPATAPSPDVPEPYVNKWPLRWTIAFVAVVCSAFWAGVAYTIFRLTS